MHRRVPGARDPVAGRVCTTRDHGPLVSRRWWTPRGQPPFGPGGVGGAGGAGVGSGRPLPVHTRAATALAGADGAARGASVDRRPPGSGADGGCSMRPLGLAPGAGHDLVPRPSRGGAFAILEWTRSELAGTRAVRPRMAGPATCGSGVQAAGGRLLAAICSTSRSTASRGVPALTCTAVPLPCAPTMARAVTGRARMGS